MPQKRHDNPKVVYKRKTVLQRTCLHVYAKCVTTCFGTVSFLFGVDVPLKRDITHSLTHTRLSETTARDE